MDDNRKAQNSSAKRHGLRLIRCDKAEGQEQQSATTPMAQATVARANARQNPFVQMMTAYADAIDQQIETLFES